MDCVGPRQKKYTLGGRTLSSYHYFPTRLSQKKSKNKILAIVQAYSRILGRVDMYAIDRVSKLGSKDKNVRHPAKNSILNSPTNKSIFSSKYRIIQTLKRKSIKILTNLEITINQVSKTITKIFSIALHPHQPHHWVILNNLILKSYKTTYCRDNSHCWNYDWYLWYML